MIDLNDKSRDEIISFIRDYTEWGSNRAYIITSMARPKENDSLSHNSMPMFREIISDKENIDRKLRDIESKSDGYRSTRDEEITFRLYLSANARDIRKSFFMFQKDLIDMNKQISNGHEETLNKIKRLDSHWKSTIQTEGNKDDSYFIIDIDSNETDLLEEIKSDLKNRTMIREHLKTPNGHHIITDPFNYTEFERGEDTEIKTDDLFYLSYI